MTLRAVSRFYGHRLIFKDVNLELPPASVTLLAGPNGAGKTTLLRIMAGLIRPSSGDVRHGANARGDLPRIGYVSHQTFLYPDLTALENLRFWTSLHGLSLSDETCGEMLRRVELTPFAEEKVRGFSRGMAQRLNLARVFLLRPDLLLLDEPGTGLDTCAMGILRHEVAAARAAGAGIVWITHTVTEDLPLADNVAVLENKRLVFSGTAAQFTARSADGVRPSGESPLRDKNAAHGGDTC